MSLVSDLLPNFEHFDFFISSGYRTSLSCPLNNDDCIHILFTYLSEFVFLTLL